MDIIIYKWNNKPKSSEQGVNNILCKHYISRLKEFIEIPEFIENIIRENAYKQIKYRPTYEEIKNKLLDDINFIEQLAKIRSNSADYDLAEFLYDNITTDWSLDVLKYMNRAEYKFPPNLIEFLEAI